MNNKTKAALSSLEFAISLSDNKPKQDDEFTVSEYARLSRKSHSQSKKILADLIEQNILTLRKISIDGRLTNLYSKA